MIARGGALLAATLLQVTLVSRLDPAIPEPNLPLLVIVAWAWLEGGPLAMRWAVAAGLLLDLAGTGPLGLHALCLLAAAYVAGLLAAPLGGGSPLVAAVAGAAAAAVYSGVLLIAADGLGLAAVSARSALPLVAGQALVAALGTPPAVAIAGRWTRRPLALPA